MMTHTEQAALLAEIKKRLNHVLRDVVYAKDQWSKGYCGGVTAAITAIDDSERYLTEHGNSCVKCGGKGYIQFSPTYYETDSAAECEDARIMARSRCDCQE